MVQEILKRGLANFRDIVEIASGPGDVLMERKHSKTSNSNGSKLPAAGDYIVPFWGAPVFYATVRIYGAGATIIDSKNTTYIGYSATLKPEEDGFIVDFQKRSVPGFRILNLAISQMWIWEEDGGRLITGTYGGRIARQKTESTYTELLLPIEARGSIQNQPK